MTENERKERLRKFNGMCEAVDQHAPIELGLIRARGGAKAIVVFAEGLEAHQGFPAEIDTETLTLYGVPFQLDPTLEPSEIALDYQDGKTWSTRQPRQTRLYR